MESLILRYSSKVLGSLSCFDRVIFNGHLSRLNHERGVEGWLYERGLQKKDFGGVVKNCAARICRRAAELAKRRQRPLLDLRTKVAKDDLAKEIAGKDGVKRGLIAVMAAIEPCRTFRLLYGQRRQNLRIEPRQAKCKHVYFYLFHAVLGFMYVRIQTWLPFQVQVYVNGHEWLARQLTTRRLRHERAENAFSWIASPDRAQEIGHEFVHLPWQRLLDGVAGLVNPLMDNLLSGLGYYWCTDQSEYSTDLMFREAEDLQQLRPALLDHAIRSFGPDSVMNFLGRRLTTGIKDEIVSDLSHRWPGSRIKHRAGRNWIKLYDKQGSILRVETVINDSRAFYQRRRGMAGGPHRWRVMPKHVSFLAEVEKISEASNARYLDALAKVPEPSPQRRALQALAAPLRVQTRGVAPLNPASAADAALAQAVMRGEHLINGFRNRDIRRLLYPDVADKKVNDQRSQRVSHLLRRLAARGLIVRIPASHRWELTPLGKTALPALLRFHQRGLQAAA